MTPGLLRPTIGVREPSRTLSVLPLSVFVHILVVLALVVIPLLATDELPAVLGSLALSMPATSVPEVPPPPVPAGQRPPAIIESNANAAPSVAPSGIAQDSGLEPSGLPPEDAVVQPGVIGGIAGAHQLEELTPPPPAPVPREPIRPGGVIKQPVKVVDVQPIYPEGAKAARIEGYVILEAVIGPTGDVQQVRVLKSQPLLDAAAVTAVRQWKFTPTLLNGTPVPVVMTVTVNFTLRR